MDWINRNHPPKNLGQFSLEQKIGGSPSFPSLRFMSKILGQKPRLPALFAIRWCRISVILWILAGNAFAQYEAGVSETGPDSAENRKSVKTFDRGPSNLRVGPVELKFDGGLNQEFNDNINLAATQKEGDWITSPHIGMHAHWPISQLNSLDIILELAYAKYWQHPELDTSTILIRPNSVLDFDLYIKDIHINFYDKIALQQDPATDPQLSNLAAFRRLTNSGGFDAEWDLNKLFVGGGYENDVFKALDDQFAALNRMSHTVRGKVGVRAASTLNVGVLSSYSINEYEQPIQNNSQNYYTGIFADSIISEYMQARATVGYENFSFDQSGTIGDSSNFESIVYAASLQNQLNRWLSHSGEFRRFATLGIGNNFVDIYELNYQANTDIIRNVASSITFYYQWYHDSPSALAEQGTRYGIGGQLGYQLFEATTLRAGYQRTEKDSNLSVNDYIQNRFFIDVMHQF
jgi:hypothetical protein